MRSVTKLVLAGLALSSLVACGSPQVTAPQTASQAQASMSQSGFRTQWRGGGFGLGAGLGAYGLGLGYGLGAFGLGCGYGTPFAMAYNPLFSGACGLGIGAGVTTGALFPTFGMLYSTISSCY